MSVPGSAYKLLISCPSGISRSQVTVDFSASFDRIPHPDNNLEKSIDEFGGCTLKSTDGSRENSICLKLGLTDYRTFVGTNLNPLWENFLTPSEDDSIRCQHMASPLGNGAIVETSDKKILVLQRSFKVGEFPGYFVFPGGHSEANASRKKTKSRRCSCQERYQKPNEVGISAHSTHEASADPVLLNQKVAEEMFDGIIREVVEEIGVPAPSLTDPVFIGISCRELNVRPTAFFFLKCNLESEVVHKLYSNAQDGYESIQLYAMSRSDIDSVTLKIPGCHRGGYALYEFMAASGDS